MSDLITISLPAYAIRYLREMCKRDREYITAFADQIAFPSMGSEASYDSLNQIECSLPSEDQT
jgi:hypothetical protein